MQYEPARRAASRPRRCPEAAKWEDAFLGQFLIDSALGKGHGQDVAQGAEGHEDGDDSLGSVSKDLAYEERGHGDTRVGNLLGRRDREVGHVRQEVEDTAYAQPERTCDLEGTHGIADLVQDVCSIVPAGVGVEHLEEGSGIWS